MSRNSDQGVMYLNPLSLGTKRAAHKFTAADCYELGLLAYKHEKFVRMLEWLQQAEHLKYLGTVDGEDRVGNLTEYPLFEHLPLAERYTQT